MYKAKIWICAFAALCLSATVHVGYAKTDSSESPGCDRQTPQQCVKLAIDAMGGRDRLLQVASILLQTVGHTLLAEQSYRQDPFITSYDSARITLDLANQRMLSENKLTWPESDPKQAESESLMVTGPEGCVTRRKDSDKDGPCGLASLDAARQLFALGPVRLLLTAAAAPDLHFEKPEPLRSTPHTVVAFTWQKIPVRILLNSFNHLPDAVDTTQQFNDFWYFWGDVRQRTYYDNWELVQGISYPTNLVIERNGILWRSVEALDVEFNVPLADSAFRMDAAVAKQSANSPGWKRPFRAGQDTVLAPGVDLFLGAWNSTIVKQADGLVILEAPISETYTQGVIEEARKRYPGVPVKAVLSTSDSWPHTGGVRYALSQKLPVYILDLNRPLLDKMVAAPHTLDPDALQKSKPSKSPNWKIVSGREEVGNGPNRMELYPLRGASTERQYMVYFPEHHLLYASDTLVLNDDNTLYDPELMNEVVHAVERANLKVDTVFAMHQGPVPWSQVQAQLEKSYH